MELRISRVTTGFVDQELRIRGWNHEIQEAPGLSDGERLRKEMAQQSIGVLVRAALPRTAGVSEGHRNASRDLELRVGLHLLAAVPGVGRRIQ